MKRFRKTVFMIKVHGLSREEGRNEEEIRGDQCVVRGCVPFHDL